jgi:quinol monooxygenase YgiN
MKKPLFPISGNGVFYGRIIRSTNLFPHKRIDSNDRLTFNLPSERTEENMESVIACVVFEKIALQMTSNLDLSEVLATISQSLVDELGATFATIRLLDPGDMCDEWFKASYFQDQDNCLHFEANAGSYTNLSGEYRRVPLPSNRFELLQTFQELVKRKIGEKGCITRSACQDFENENTFCLSVELKIQQNLDRHLRSDLFDVLLAQIAA